MQLAGVAASRPSAGPPQAGPHACGGKTVPTFKVSYQAAGLSIQREAKANPPVDSLDDLHVGAIPEERIAALLCKPQRSALLARNP